MGVVNLFADITYEGASSINGPFLGMLGASAAAIGVISGVGEFLLRGYNYGYETITNPDGSTSTVHHGPELCRMCHLK